MTEDVLMSGWLRRSMNSWMTAVGLVVSVMGCGSHEGSNSDSPGIEFEPESSSLSFKLENFTDAEWLYQNYFGEYGLPEAFKKGAMVELKMAANGFAYLAATGKEPREYMTEFDGMLRKGLSDAITDLVKTPGNSWFTDPDTATELMKNWEPREEPLLIANASRFGEAQDDGFVEYVQEQERLVKDYQLPYELPGSATKIMVFGQLAGPKGGKGGGGGTSTPSNSQWGPHDHNLYNMGLHSGDMLFANTPASNKFFDSSIQGYWGHVAIWTESLVDVKIIDAMPANSERSDRFGVDYAILERFRRGYKRLASVKYYDMDNVLGGRLGVVGFVTKQIGKSYTFNVLKGEGTYRGYYCSLLVWEAYKKAVGLDFDTNGGVAVTPDDLYADWRLATMAKSQSRL